MKMVPSVELVWQLAGQEATAGRFEEIEPEHFFLALLKFSELPVQEVGRIAAEADAVKQLSQDVQRVRRTVQEAGIDSATVRRKLREQLGKGQGKPDGGAMHRSAACRKLFDAAVAKVNVEQRRPDPDTPIGPHDLLAVLLESPTAAMKAVMGKAEKKRPAMPGPLGPLLQKYGRELTARSLIVQEPNPAAVKVISGLLSGEDGRSVLLVEGKDGDSRMLVCELSVILQLGQGPLSAKRIVELANLPSRAKEDEVLDILGRILAEAAQAKDLILVVPSMMFFRQKTTGEAWRKLLHDVMSQRTIQCLCPAPPDAYRRVVEPDRSWKRVAHVMHVRSAGEKDIPDEL